MSDNDSLLNTGAGTDASPAQDTPPADPPAQDTPPAAEAPKSPSSEVAAIMQEGWKDFIPEDLRDRSEWTRVNTLQDVFKNYIEGQQTISKSVRIPDANATAEELNAFYGKLGKPATKEEYTFEYTPKEGDKLGKEAYDFSVFQEIAEKANLTADQYQALATAYMDIQNQNLNNYNMSVAEQAGAEVKQAEEALRKEWGRDYAANINNISAKITQMYPEETVRRMEDSGLFRDVNFLKSQLALTKMMTGDTIFIEGRGVENVPQTIEDLRAKRDALMESDYVKNKAQVNELNKQIVQLQTAQQGQIGRRFG